MVGHRPSHARCRMKNRTASIQRTRPPAPSLNLRTGPFSVRGRPPWNSGAGSPLPL